MTRFTRTQISVLNLILNKHSLLYFSAILKKPPRKTAFEDYDNKFDVFVENSLSLTSLCFC